MENFNAKLTKKFIYLDSKLDENRKYRISPRENGSLKKMWKFLNNTELKLIPLLKFLDKRFDYFLETRTTQNKSTLVWLWAAGYQRCWEFPKGTVGGLSFNGTLFSGEFDDDGKPILLGRNANCQNKGALKGMKTDKGIEWSENHPKFSESELNALKADRIRRGIF